MDHKHISRYSSSDLKSLITNTWQGVARTQSSRSVLLSIDGSFTVEPIYAAE